MNPKVSIIILNWNGLSDTIECLESVQKINYPNYNVMVVDNGSTDNSIDEIEKLYPKILIVRSKYNMGYAGGNNLGVKTALKNGTDYILLLNNDTVIDKAMVKNLVDAAGRYLHIGIFGCKTFYYSDKTRICSLGAKWDPANRWFYRLGINELESDGMHDTLQEVDYVSGCAIFFNQKIIERIGMFDTRYFLNYEETDWCYRARKNGIKCACVPDAKVWHKISVSFGGQETPMYNYFMTRNELLWARKNLPFRERMQVYKRTVKSFLPNTTLYTSPILFKRLYWDIRRLLRKDKNPLFKAKLQGFVDFVLCRFGSQKWTYQS